jgi:hypothetical protein
VSAGGEAARGSQNVKRKTQESKPDVPRSGAASVYVEAHFRAAAFMLRRRNLPG